MTTHALRVLLVLLAGQIFGQTAWWEQQNPKPQSNSLYDVAMLDPARFIAVGAGGFILKTTDDGENWNVQTIGTPALDLMSVAFSRDKQHGITISRNGRIYYTADQGETWELSPYTDTTDLFDVYFRTEREAYAVGKFGRFIRTSDAGQTWVREAFEFPDYLQSVHFPDTLNGFIGGRYGIFYSTSDGGASWRRRELPFSNTLNAIHAANGKELATAGEAGGVFLSNDSGYTWQRQEIRWGLAFNDVFRQSTQRVSVCGLRYSFFKTTNGGTLWEAAHGGLIKSAPLNAIDFSGLQGVCVGNDGYMFRSTDGGDTWFRIYTNVAEDETLRAVACLDSITAIAVGSSIVRTADRGEKWERIPNVPQVLGTLRGVSFPSRNIGFAVGDYGTVLKTTDEGLTWRRLQTPFGSDLTAVSFLNNDTGIAVAATDNGTIVQTWDGGITWKVGKAPSILKLYGAAYLSPSTIVISGFENRNSLAIEVGVCLRSTDGGWTWTEHYAGMPMSATSISFSDSLRGFVAGTGISMTSDGGVTWRLWSSPALARAISSPDSLRATAVLKSGGSFHTTDGGLTWNSVPTFATQSFYGIDHPTAQSATAVGYRAMIFRMTTTDPPLAVDHRVAAASTSIVTSIFPNPARHRLSVQLKLERSEELVLRLYRVDGLFMRTLFDGVIGGSEAVIDCDVHDLASGSYILEAAASQTEYHSVTIVK